MDKARELLACAHCDGPADYVGREGKGYRVQCKHCGAQSGWGDYGYQVEAKWNKRAALTPPEAVREPTREMVVVGMAWLRDFDTLSKNDKAKFVAEAYKAMARHALTPPEAVRDAVEALKDVIEWTDCPPDNRDPWPKFEAAHKALASLLSRVPTPAPDAVAGDGRAICEALGFDPINHHNAAKCPYCNPEGLAFVKPAAPAPASVHTIAHDGFTGSVIGQYVTREGKRGVVLQQIGTRVVHVYGEKWLAPPLPLESDNAGEVG